MTKSYELLDSGDLSKLEIVGGYKLQRSSPTSAYGKETPEIWKDLHATYIKNDSGSGHWNFQKKVPESFTIEFSNLTFKIKLTPFGHIGLFPEQETNWNRIREIGKKKQGLEVLNLFAYSGGSTLACLDAGMSVCHVDASKGMVDWARENAKLSGLDSKPVRWIVDDVMKFIRREIKRGKKYQGLILDPPSFGRGSKGEVWKIEENLSELMDALMELSDSKPEFVILSCHSQGFSPLTLERILSSRIKTKGNYETTELYIPETSGKKYPAGFCTFFKKS
ncbi:SAM-dependent methyltransferase [Leptospira levettii]|uniref:class I SAM-dependent methyltransferase n=1 Tax=Leptospira levettii TaxID=2023178 RepID=UPI000C2A8E3E|nr:class I SAM-dependent methyltransferase [Leptospira levettii]MCW7473299.1 class I SAM-dependent methyltransferase [Leptospira levettii]PJZ37720.1 SAM-dependent methyltransferase [Leptospira levettii]PJZ90430.1 SAM-dependent methyltransferase [Leptospira levettii]PKA01528.1 SAM-dependent methyltransferase [Leptospira levettii]